MSAVRRVLVCGGTGVLGAHLVPMLVAAGHDVAVLARSDEAAARIAGWGAQPAAGDLFDRESLARAVARRHVVVHAATRLPKVFPGRPADFAANDRVRREGTRILLDVAAASGVARVVLQSIVWVHGDQDGAWIDEDATLRPGVVARSAVDAEAMAREASAHHGFAVDVLRCAGFYDAAAYHTRELVARLRSRSAPIIGAGANYQCFVHAEDAARAFSLAAGATGGGDTYFVTDDEPVRLGEYLAWLARAAGAPDPRRVPEFLARLALGADMADAYSASLRCRNDRLKQQLSWAPRFPTFRDGLAEVLPRLDGPPG